MLLQASFQSWLWAALPLRAILRTGTYCAKVTNCPGVCKFIKLSWSIGSEYVIQWQVAYNRTKGRLDRCLNYFKTEQKKYYLVIPKLCCRLPLLLKVAFLRASAPVPKSWHTPTKNFLWPCGPAALAVNASVDLATSWCKATPAAIQFQSVEGATASVSMSINII